MMESLLTQSEFETLVERKFKTTDFEILDRCISNDNPDEKLGFQGDHLRVHFKILLENKPVKFSLFLKNKLDQENPLYKLSDGARCYEREIKYLKFVRKHWDEQHFDTHSTFQWIPSIYYNKSDLLFILECMSSHNFELAKSQKCARIDLAHTKCVFKSLAQMHAFSIIHEEKVRAAGNLEYSLLDDFSLIEPLLNRDFLGGALYLEQSIDSGCSLIDILPENNVLAPEKFKDLFKRKIENVIETVNTPSKIYRNVLCHGDLWLNNFLFKYSSGKPSECCLVDFQFIRYLPPMHDIYFYLYVNTTCEFREKHTDELLKYYYEMLTESLTRANLDINQILPWDSFLESGQLFESISKIFGLFYLQIHLSDESYWEKFLRDPEFIEDYFFRNRSKYVLESYAKSAFYRAWLVEIMVDIRNMLIKEYL